MSNLIELRGLDGRALLRMSEYSMTWAVVTEHANGQLCHSHLGHFTQLGARMVMGGVQIDQLFAGSLWLGSTAIGVGPFHYLRGELSKPGVVPMALKDFWFVHIESFTEGTEHQQLLGEFLEKVPG